MKNLQLDVPIMLTSWSISWYLHFLIIVRTAFRPRLKLFVKTLMQGTVRDNVLFSFCIRMLAFTSNLPTGWSTHWRDKFSRFSNRCLLVNFISTGGTQILLIQNFEVAFIAYMISSSDSGAQLCRSWCRETTLSGNFAQMQDRNFSGKCHRQC